MKVLFNHLGRTLIAVLCAVLVIGGFNEYLIPEIQNYSKKAVVKEVNLRINEDSNAPALNCVNSNIRVKINDNVNIFSGITARTAGGSNLIQTFREDYNKPARERKYVFVYRLCDDHTSVLASEIDTSKEGEWVVVFCAKDGSNFKTLAVHYEVYDPEIVVVT